MKRITALALMIAAAALWAGCGGSNNAGNGAGANKAANAPDDDHDHDHDSHSGAKHNLGKLTLGGMAAEVTQIGEPDLGKETIFEIKLEKDGKAVSDATVTGWLADEGGKELGAAGNGEWNAKENMYDVHAHTPKTLPAKVMLWVKVVAKDGTESKGSVEIHKH